jgi:hypothetical protein
MNSALEKKPSLLSQFYSFLTKKTRSSQVKTNQLDNHEYLISIKIRRPAGPETKRKIKITFYERDCGNKSPPAEIFIAPKEIDEICPVSKEVENELSLIEDTSSVVNAENDDSENNSENNQSTLTETSLISKVIEEKSPNFKKGMNNYFDNSIKINLINTQQEASLNVGQIQEKLEFEPFPFNELSKTIKLKILSFFKYDLKHVAVIRQVCCEWNRLFKTEPCLQITELEIDPAFLFNNLFNKYVVLESSSRLFKNAQDELNAADDQINSIDGIKFMCFVRCIMLRYVDLRKLTKFRINYFRQKCQMEQKDYISFMMRNLPSLTSIDMSGLQVTRNRLFTLRSYFALNLQELDLTGSNASDRMIVDILSQCLKLESLILRRTHINASCLLAGQSMNLKRIDIRFCAQVKVDFLIKYLDRSRKLTHFYISGVKGSIVQNLGKNVDLARFHVQLNDMSLERDLILGWRRLLMTPNSLTELNLSYSSVLKNSEWFDDLVFTALNYSEKLTVLNLNYCESVSDETFCVGLVNARLVELHLAGTRVTLKSFRFLEPFLSPTLRALNISGCKLLSESEVLAIVAGFENVTTIETSFENAKRQAVVPRTPLPLAPMAKWDSEDEDGETEAGSKQIKVAKRDIVIVALLNEEEERIVRFLEHLLRCENRFFNLYGFAQERTLNALSELVKRTETASLGYKSICYKNFRIHFESLAKPLNT